MKNKVIPERMCVACREMKPKNQLFRIVKLDGNDVATLDETGKSGGRGVYLCKCEKCIAAAAKNKNFAKNYGIKLDEELIARLENAIER